MCFWVDILNCSPPHAPGCCVWLLYAIFQAGAKGMGCPPADEMKMVVTSAGGQWLPSIPKVSSLCIYLRKT